METEQKELLIAEVDYSEAQEFADLTSILQDLNACIKTCQRLIRIIDQPEPDPILEESLWTASLIRYARCFATGKRFGLSEEFLANLNGDPIGAHRYYINMRNKNIAHSVNPFEQVKIGLLLSDPQIEKKVIGIVNLSQRHICAKKDGVDTLMRLCIVIKNKLVQDWKECQDKVLNIGRTLSVEELYSQSHMQTVTPSPTDVGKVRSS